MMTREEQAISSAVKAMSADIKAATPATKSERFRRWFRDSKVVDSRGRPLPVFHGTTAKFDAFRPFYRKNEELGFGVHFAVKPEFAGRYAFVEETRRKGDSPQIIPAYLSVQRPLYSNQIVTEGTPEFALAKKFSPKQRLYMKSSETGLRYTWLQAVIDATSAKRAEKIIRDAGYDGVRYGAMIRKQTGYGLAKVDESEAWIVFEPTQIKHAVLNVGEFDPNDPVIVNPSKKPSESLADATWKDLRDGLEMVSESFGEDGPFEAKKISKPKLMTLEDVGSYDDVGAWLDIEEGELVGLDDEELRDRLSSFRGGEWADRAMSWRGADGVWRLPTIAIFVGPTFSSLGDGRGRYNLAVGLGLKRIPVSIVEVSKKRRR